MKKKEPFRFGHSISSVLMLAGLAMACATTPMPDRAPISATPPRGHVVPAHSVVLLDASGSNASAWADGKATLEALVGVMPNGHYAAGIVVFGGYDRKATGSATFERAKLASAAKMASFLGGATPLFDVIENDLVGAIGGTHERAAVVLISDGQVTDYVGRRGVDSQTLDAARSLAAGRSGETCFHTIQVGRDAAGAAFLEALADVSGCGSFRRASSLGSAAALEEFSREVYMDGPAPPRPKSIAPAKSIDSDRDGVVDSADRCPHTLRNARVDSRGCWTLSGIRFAVNRADLAGTPATTLKEDLAVLRANPRVRIRVDGHTDSDGSEPYNRLLSRRRAAAVRDYFVEQGGLDADRFEIEGFGESAPIAPNDTPAHKRLNRRVELTLLD